MKCAELGVEASDIVPALAKVGGIASDAVPLADEAAGDVDQDSAASASVVVTALAHASTLTSPAAAAGASEQCADSPSAVGKAIVASKQTRRGRAKMAARSGPSEKEDAAGAESDIEAESEELPDGDGEAVLKS